MARANNEVSFGAVYEHRVNGVPKYVGSTDMLPEDKFRYEFEYSDAYWIHDGLRTRLPQRSNDDYTPTIN